ncbi:hypothetical protein LRB11_14480 [Ectothiorhodospira haloalkaliphila]|uniref:hypothetical protein n=1 Tax=Ectothiorhodospira haloalkaliphila TaxID=421628 RepID=UPI001EE87758|nr:hypothetical protein [Ectothiorhodospira haloalkaliphila]MCG5526120.1 hypothetical protein [Ectothiorhodospira haloalkaliphila]
MPTQPRTRKAGLILLTALATGPLWAGEVPVIPPEAIVTPTPPTPPVTPIPEAPTPPVTIVPPPPPPAPADPGVDTTPEAPEDTPGVAPGGVADLPPVIRGYSVSNLTPEGLEAAAEYVGQALNQSRHGASALQGLEELLEEIQAEQTSREAIEAE